MVPRLVRVADLIWTMGVMSNFYFNSPIRVPCSAYSLTGTLVHLADFWDTSRNTPNLKSTFKKTDDLFFLLL